MMNGRQAKPQFPKELETASPIVKIRSGMVRGESFAEFDRFLGIPFAQPPVGELRYQHPVTVESWDDVFDATQYGSPVPTLPPYTQLELATNIRADDNWLNLNVWVPKNVRESAPVFVWIFGGGYKSGSNAELLYAGDTFARDGVVYVNINYRLGIEGFGAFPDAPHNRGIADQILALEWVRDNIAAFGGDPHNVTVGGQSAGSMCIGILLACPRAQGLFHRAILQSGPPILLSKESNRAIIMAIAEDLGIEPTAESFARKTVAEIKNSVLKIQQKDYPAGLGLPFSPVIDTDLIPYDPNEVLQINASPVPLLVGYTAAECSFITRILHILPEITWENMRAFTSGIRSEILDIYREFYHSSLSAEEVYIKLMSDRIFTAPLFSLIKAQPEKAYAYIFAWESPDNDYLARHGLDLPFVFDHLDTRDGIPAIGENAPQELADHMHKIWVNFISTGNPGWPTSGALLQFYCFNYPIQPFSALISEPHEQLLALW